MSAPTFVETSKNIFDLDGVSWHEAPIPRRWHKCWVQTWGWLGYFDRVQRCACGAIRCVDPVEGPGLWGERNQRRRAS